MVLAANPSHLEFVNSVVLGRCRGKQRLVGDTERKMVVPVIVRLVGVWTGGGSRMTHVFGRF